MTDTSNAQETEPETTEPEGSKIVTCTCLHIMTSPLRARGQRFGRMICRVVDSDPKCAVHGDPDLDDDKDASTAEDGDPASADLQQCSDPCGPPDN